MASFWPEEDIAHFYDLFWRELEPALFMARQQGLELGMASGYRSNARQKELNDAYVAALKAWTDGGKKGPPPVQAAKPGGSAHNYAVCPADIGHRIGGAETCPECGGPVEGASLAADVSVWVKGKRIPSGGALPLGKRPEPWQRWAGILKLFPALRDGGSFSKPDPVHVEYAKWDVTTRGLKP